MSSNLSCKPPWEADLSPRRWQVQSMPRGRKKTFEKLSGVTEKGDLAFRGPLVITRERAVIDGYARWKLAHLKRRLTIPCIEHELTDEEALYWLLLRHCRSNGLNEFSQTSLVLELEPSFKV